MRSMLAITGMGLCALAAWLLQHPYAGLVHDAVLYTLPALVRLHPDALSRDIFLRFGSQDQYTLFSPIYSEAIAFLGLEPAAAILTLVSQLAFFACAWLLARRFMSALAATLAVALLILVPGEYGSGSYFHYSEAFLTSRLPAEALVLGALAATLARRYWIAAVCMLAAMLLHPIMAAAGAAMITLTFLAPSRPRLVIAGGATLLLGSLLILQVSAPLGRMDATWLQGVRVLNPFLYLSSWSARDWTRITTALALLPIGLLKSAAPVRKVCAGALLTALCGLLISALYCDVLHVTIFTALQAWRWLWVADVIAIILAPVIVADCWRSGAAGRTAITLLGTAWLLHGDGAAAWILGLCFACAATPERWREHRYMRVAFFGACGVLVVVAGALMAELSYLPADTTGAPALLQQLRLVCANGIIPGALLLAAWLGLRRSESSVGSVVVIIAASLACAALVPADWASWTHGSFTPVLREKLAPWRAEIPPDAEVLWPVTPIGAWYLLERPSYWSTYQLAGGIFSRQKSLLLQQRTEVLNAAIKTSGPTRKSPGVAGVDLPELPNTSRMTPDDLTRACGDHDLRYVVSWLRLGQTSFAPITPDPAKPLSRLYLYRCSDRGRPDTGHG